MDIVTNGIPYVLGFSLMSTFALIAGLRARRYWTVCLFYYLGYFLILGLTLEFIVILATLAGAFAIQSPAGLVTAYVELAIMILLLAPAAYFLQRALRLRYWQPSSTPDQWEVGDEGPPAWALSPRDNGGR